MKEEIVTPQLIKDYINKISHSFGIYPDVRETALKIQFDCHLYAECVLEIVRKMGIQNKIRVRKYSEEKWHTPNATAVIGIPDPMPRFGTMEFKQMEIVIEIRDAIKNNFYPFIKTIAHELSHVIMFSTKHELCHSEVATDLCAMVFGFSDFFMKGHTIITMINPLFQEVKRTGYLNESQIKIAAEYIKIIQRERGLI